MNTQLLMLVLSIVVLTLMLEHPAAAELNGYKIKNAENESGTHKTKSKAKISFVESNGLDYKTAHLIKRLKRATLQNVSPGQQGSNGTIKFHNTVEDLNEDILQNFNRSGIIQAYQIKPVNLASLFRKNTSDADPIRIAHNEQNGHENAADKKIDHELDEKYEKFFVEKLARSLDNSTNKSKDQKLSKIAVSELMNRSEIIGDMKAPVTSNITFTSENYTISAITFVVGNLINKLWALQDSNGSAEVIRQDNIDDLLEIFNEPHTSSEEIFIENTLEILFEAMAKNENIRNISISQEIKEVRTLMQSVNNVSKDSPETTDQSVRQLAVDKINTLLNLIKKMELVQENFKNLKNCKNFITDIQESKVEVKKHLTSGYFNNFLTSVMKLLMPGSQRIIRKIIHNSNGQITDWLKEKITKLFNLDLENKILSQKCFLLANLIQNLATIADCKLNESYNSADDLQSLGDVMIKLFEFFKIKSFVDLTNVWKRNGNDIWGNDAMLKQNIILKPIHPENNVSNTRLKLKEHLKAIIRDLIEIQKERRVANEAMFEINDALPCLHNILNSDKIFHNSSEQYKKSRKQINNFKNIAKIFEFLGKDLINSSSRPSNVQSDIESKSPLVWERMVNKFIGQNQQYNARSNVEKILNYKVLKKVINNEETTSASKNFAFVSQVLPSNKLTELLRTLELDIRNYIDVLNKIKASLSTLERLPLEEWINIMQFIDSNCEFDIIRRHLRTPTGRISDDYSKSWLENSYIRGNKNEQIKLPNKSIKKLIADNTKSTRDEVISRLIQNRLSLYLKLIKIKKEDLTDMKNRIAKRTLELLDDGKFELAKELYKLIVSKKPQRTIQNGGTFLIDSYEGEVVEERSSATREDTVEFASLHDQKGYEPQDHQLLKHLLLDARNHKL